MAKNTLFEGKNEEKSKKTRFFSKKVCIRFAISKKSYTFASQLRKTTAP